MMLMLLLFLHAAETVAQARGHYSTHVCVSVCVCMCVSVPVCECLSVSAF